MKITVINIKNYNSDDYIYIGRPSKYGNPYSSKNSKYAKKVKSRKESLKLFENYIDNNQHLIDEIIKELKDKKINKLGCFCSPKKCHGDILKKYIERREKVKNMGIFNENIK